MASKLWNYARKIVTSISGLSCLMIGFCIIAQIFCRFFLGIALTWSEEIAQVGMILMVFLALAEVESGDEHLKVEILFSVFPKLSFGMTMVGKLLTLVYSGIILYSGCLMLPSVQRTLAKASKFPIRYLYYAMLLGILIWMIQTVINMVKMVKERGAQK